MTSRTVNQVEWVDIDRMKRDAPRIAEAKGTTLQDVLDNIGDYCPQEEYTHALTFSSLEAAFSWAEKNHAKCAFNQPRVSVYEVTEETHDEPERWEEVEAWYVTSDGTEREPIDLD